MVIPKAEANTPPGKMRRSVAEVATIDTIVASSGEQVFTCEATMTAVTAALFDAMCWVSDTSFKMDVELADTSGVLRAYTPSERQSSAILNENKRTMTHLWWNSIVVFLSKNIVIYCRSQNCTRRSTKNKGNARTLDSLRRQP